MEICFVIPWLCVSSIRNISIFSCATCIDTYLSNQVRWLFRYPTFYIVSRWKQKIERRKTFHIYLPFKHDLIPGIKSLFQHFHDVFRTNIFKFAWRHSWLDHGAKQEVMWDGKVSMWQNGVFLLHGQAYEYRTYKIFRILGSNFI